MKKKILLYGFYSQGNFGDDALLYSILENLKKKCSYDLSFDVAVRHPSETMDKQFNISTVQNLEYFQRCDSIGRWIQGFNPDDGHDYMSFLKKIVGSDLVIIGPGQWLVETKSDALWKGILAQFDAITEMCSMVGTKCYGIALTCESLLSSFSLLRLQNSLSKLSALSFRDSNSSQYLKQKGISLPYHENHVDLAFATPSEDLNPDFFIENDINTESHDYLGIAIHSVYWSEAFNDKIKKIVPELIIRWIEKTNLNVLMIPQAINLEDAHADDRIIHKQIYDELPKRYKLKVKLITANITFKECKQLYSLCQVTFCSRMHGSIFSILQNTPTLLIDFEKKRRFCFELAELQDYLCSIDSPIDVIFDKIIEISESSSARKNLKLKTNILKDDALKHIDVACDLLNTRLSDRQIWSRTLLK